MKKRIVRDIVLLCCLVISAPALSQSIWTNPITGTNPNLSNPYTTGNVFDANITVNGISRGAGAVSTNANDRYNASSWNTAGIDLTAYFEFTLTPNAGCEIDFTSFVYTGQASGTGPTSFAFRSSLDGYTANIGTPNATGTTISLAAGAYQNITSAITFRFYAWGASAVGGTFSINDFTFNGAVTCGCSGPVAQPTTETTADTATPTCTSATINWTASTTADNVIVVVSTGAISDVPTDGVAYTANAGFASGEELVAADAQYVVYNGSGTSVTVTGLTAGTTYNYAIFGYDGVTSDCEENYLTGGNFGSFTTATGCASAQITSLMINSCNGTAEGTDELIIIENGSEPIDVNDMVIDLPNTTWCNSGCGGNTIVNNPTYVSQLNTMAGCSPDLFVYSDPIPAGATIIIFTGDPPSTVLDYSANCGAPGAPLYVLFLNNNSITGNFANTGAAAKIIDIDFGNGQTDLVSYIPDDVANVDGGSVNYDDAGNPTYYTSTDCVYPLAVRMAYFHADRNTNSVDLNWATYSQTDAQKFLIQRSDDGVNFETLDEIPLSGNSDELLTYHWQDVSPIDFSVSYYRIATVDNNQLVTYSNLAQILPLSGVLVYYAESSLQFFVEDVQPNTAVIIYSMDGSVVYSGFVSEKMMIPFDRTGVYIIEIPSRRFRTKVVCF